MKGLQLDDVSMKKLELDMREEVSHIFELEMQILFDTDALRIKKNRNTRAIDSKATRTRSVTW